jgi:streptomycin 6-kinase
MTEPRGPGGRVRLPAGVLALAERGEEWAAWVARLPVVVRELLAEWKLTLDGPATGGAVSMVVPVRTGTGGEAVLKVGFPDEESEHEHLALQHWHGNGAVRLLRADPRRRALLLERLETADLGELWDLQACELVGELYGRLHVPAPPQLRPLSGRVRRWVELLGSLPRSAPVPRRLVEQALSIAGDLAADPSTDGVLVHTDLHYANVLAGERQPWLVIDPKPLSGDPHVEPAPMLWNRWDEVVASGDVRDAVRRRFFALVDAALLDEDRARAWVVLREVVNAVEELDELEPDRQWITASITIAKAVQD